MKKDSRWRGRMPFRACGKKRELLNLLTQERRTGESSPSTYSSTLRFFLEYHDGRDAEAKGKARGSYTERLRDSLDGWMRSRYLSTLTFEYRLSRRKTILVVGSHPYIKHDSGWGNGQRGFTLTLSILSVDGLAPARFCSQGVFAWNRIIGREKLLALPEGKLDES